ncbi:MAG: BTAD domain-containing putative transcriptional regulator [Fimbriimonas sp.]
MLEIHLFGPLRVLIQGEPMPRVRTRSVEWLLALLVLRNGRSVSRAWLAGTLWPESDETQALQNLRHDLVSLRKALGTESERLQSPTRDSLSLDLSGASCDVLSFDAAILSGDWESAAELYIGTLLEGCYKEWAVVERDLRAEQCLQALQSLAQKAADEGDHLLAVRVLRRAEAMDSLRDSTVRQLMLSLAASGDPGAAVEVYRDLRQRLHHELHATPDEATTRLFQEIRSQAAAQKPTARPTALRGKPKKAPFPLSTLIGREEEVRSVVESLAQYRLVTLIGAGGVGKTRVAIEVVRSVQDSLDSRVAWVELAPLDSPDLLVSATALALGLTEDHETDEITVQKILATVDEAPYLIAFDNCEHLMEDVAALVETLLGASPTLRILTTSRQRLGLVGEMARRVPSLAAPEPATLPLEVNAAVAEALKFPAVRLFVERAHAARPGFQLTQAEEVAAVCTIARRLDGIPLALELAAARVATLTLANIAERLDDRFSLLTMGARTALPRQKTLRALIAWSYDLLSDEEKAMLRSLSVFSGWTIEAAEAVYGSDTLDTLASLTDKSLVLAEEEGGRIRYRMLETIREYALERLRESGCEDEARDRHTTFFLRLAEDLQDPAATAILELEKANLHAALANAKPDAYVRLVSALCPYWVHRGSAFEGCVHVQAALDLCPDGQQLLDGAHALLGTLHCEQDRLAERSAPSFAGLERGNERVAVLERALAIQRRLGQRPEMVVTLRCLRSLAEDSGDFTRAEALVNEAVAIARELGNRLFLSITLHEGGCVVYRLKQYEKAVELLSQALELFSQPGGVYGFGFCSNNLAWALISHGELDRARELQRRTLAFYLEDPDWDCIVWSLAGFTKTGIGGEDAIGVAMLLGAASTLEERNQGLCDRARDDVQRVLSSEAYQSSFDRGVSLGTSGIVAEARRVFASKDVAVLGTI